MAETKERVMYYPGAGCDDSFLQRLDKHPFMGVHRFVLVDILPGTKVYRKNQHGFAFQENFHEIIKQTFGKPVNHEKKRRKYTFYHKPMEGCADTITIEYYYTRNACAEKIPDDITDIYLRGLDLSPKAVYEWLDKSPNNQVWSANLFHTPPMGIRLTIIPHCYKCEDEGCPECPPQKPCPCCKIA
jgi:hypothetical protein